MFDRGQMRSSLKTTTSIHEDKVVIAKEKSKWWYNRNIVNKVIVCYVCNLHKGTFIKVKEGIYAHKECKTKT